MARDAKPMTCPYLRTAWSGAIAVTAILWPRGTRSRAVVPATAAPAAIGSTATTTLSSAARRMVRGMVIVRLSEGTTSEPEAQAAGTGRWVAAGCRDATPGLAAIEG